MMHSYKENIYKNINKYNFYFWQEKNWNENSSINAQNMYVKKIIHNNSCVHSCNSAIRFQIKPNKVIFEPSKNTVLAVVKVFNFAANGIDSAQLSINIQSLCKSEFASETDGRNKLRESSKWEDITLALYSQEQWNLSSLGSQHIAKAGCFPLLLAVK